ncbi:unnamed protein product [Rotaria sp. Silwood2]|nr:unnamed protein product [Rotaria sp. Silwood2]
MNHSLFLKVKIQQEIKVTLQNISFMSLPTIIIFMLEIHGYSKLYDSTERFFIFVNFWTVSIHDGNYSVLKYLQPIINGAAHHNDHHQFYKYNYRQFFTLWDRLMNTFHSPHVYSEKKKNIN